MFRPNPPLLFDQSLTSYKQTHFESSWITAVPTWKGLRRRVMTRHTVLPPEKKDCVTSHNNVYEGQAREEFISDRLGAMDR